MKRLFSFMMALILVLSLGVTAFAEENTGSITVTNATIDETYAVYKIFDASIKLDSNNNSEAIAYTIDKDDQFFNDLFADPDAPENDRHYNAYLIYTPITETTGSVTKRASVNDSELVSYLKTLVYEEVDVPNEDGTTRKEWVVKEGLEPSVEPIKAVDTELTFTGLEYGYYLITSTLGTTVTISSNDPDVSVIDKNQDPVPDFDKQVQTGVDADGNPVWEDANSANIGDKISYRISFSATNYDGDKQIKYYQVHDEKGDAIWAEFDSFKVSVGGVELKRGYYLSQGGVNTGNWGYLGDWSDIPEAERDRNDAQWYLVHLDYDKFRITIPWLGNHELKDVTGGTYSLSFGEDAASKYESPVLVEIIYDAVVEANAAIGDTTHGNRFNKAYASWTSEHETQSNTPDEVVTHVYGLGLLKDEDGTWKNLAGAKFRIYSDAACTIPVHVIPTDVDGVYVKDSLGMPIESVTGTGKQPTRTVFAEYVEDYLKDKKDKDGNPLTQDNLVISQVNGKLAILGLKAGTYYLKEVEAPAGYNALSTPVPLTAGENIRPFIIFADANGHVADIQQEEQGYTEHTLNLTHTVVHNSKGVELPSTGGEGTMMMITIGTMVALAFAVLLITHKKMSIYHD